MQNDLKYGKMSEHCGINGNFAEKKKKIWRQTFSPAE